MVLMAVSMAMVGQEKNKWMGKNPGIGRRWSVPETDVW